MTDWGSPVTCAEIQDFKNCLDHLQITLLRYKVCYYSFCSKQDQQHRVYSRIDWDLGNYQWLQSYGAVEDDYLLPGISHHSLILMHCNPTLSNRPNPFKLYSTVMQHHQDIISGTWAHRYARTRMYQLAQKLKALKENLNSHMASYERHLQTTRQQLIVVQDKITNDGFNQNLIEEEKCLFKKCTIGA